jgi:serine/threonine-protein kinase
MALHPENDETVAMGAGTPPKPAANNSQRFAPGTLLASRYRIVSRLGKGGMGEVFRADDIMLGQPVALKFLPENAGRNINLLTRFYDEVRIARQISHANVCRVYDIGEIEGQPYLSMEYIDGEDLSSLLRRIGRLPGDKAAEFARKMCAGLAAAHAQGVLHRDIKPGNIMIDGRGEPRITDFGLAAVAAGIEGAEIRNGTPAYMAPEQLEGREVTVQSDLYALGLVFHEMFTGKVPHQADTVAELTRMRKESRVMNASTLVGDLDPAVDRAIQACLNPDPALRPKSALDLARMLPGGDPLAAALAAGQTPSPELVAASGSSGALSPKVGLAVFAATILGLVALAFIQPYFQPVSRLPLRNSPEVLTAKARDVLRNLGYNAPAADFALGYNTSEEPLQYLKKSVSNRDQWDDVLSKHPSYMLFWYRESTLPMRPSPITNGGRASLTSPEMNVEGMTGLILGLNGELVQFSAVPPPVSEQQAGSNPPVDWARLFALARLDQTKFQTAEPKWTPLAATDTRVAWTGLQPTTYKQPMEIPIRIEAASFQGRPIYFQVIYPWTVPTRVSAPPPVPLGRRIGTVAAYSLIVALILGALFMARHHLKTGSGDSRGAIRVGAYVGVLTLAAALLRAHVGDMDFVLSAGQVFLAIALYSFAMYWVFYLAMEPWVRKSWPHVLVTWSRILQGHWTDPIVGRDALFGTGIGILFCLSLLTAAYLLRPPDTAPEGNFQVANLVGMNHVIGVLLNNLLTGIVYIIGFLLLLFFLRVLLRKQWLAASVLVVVPALIQTQGSTAPLYIALPLNIFIYAIVVGTMLRLGVFAAIMLIFVANSMGSSLLTTDFTAWYGKSSWVVLLITAATAFWGYRTSVAGQSLVDGPAADEAQRQQRRA